MALGSCSQEDQVCSSRLSSFHQEPLFQCLGSHRYVPPALKGLGILWLSGTPCPSECHVGSQHSAIPSGIPPGSPYVPYINHSVLSSREESACSLPPQAPSRRGLRQILAKRQLERGRSLPQCTAPRQGPLSPIWSVSEFS